MGIEKKQTWSDTFPQPSNKTQLWISYTQLDEAGWKGRLKGRSPQKKKKKERKCLAAHTASFYMLIWRLLRTMFSLFYVFITSNRSISKGVYVVYVNVVEEDLTGLFLVRWA